MDSGSCLKAILKECSCSGKVMSLRRITTGGWPGVVPLLIGGLPRCPLVCCICCGDWVEPGGDNGLPGDPPELP